MLLVDLQSYLHHWSWTYQPHFCYYYREKSMFLCSCFTLSHYTFYIVSLSYLSPDMLWMKNNLQEWLNHDFTGREPWMRLFPDKLTFWLCVYNSSNIILLYLLFLVSILFSFSVWYELFLCSLSWFETCVPLPPQPCKCRCYKYELLCPVSIPFLRGRAQ